MSKPFDVLVAGEINPDLILTGNVAPEFGQVEKLIDDEELTIGSSSAIFACGAARLGLKVALIGVCGDDLFGQYMLDSMKARSVDVSHVIRTPGGQTGLSVILNQGSDRAILTHPGLISALKADDIPDTLLRQTRHLHIASYFIQTSLQPGLPQLFRRAHALSISTSLDTNWDPAERWSGLEDLLSLTDVFLPNSAEACAITRQTDIEVATKQLAEKTSIIAVKQGESGALSMENGSPIRTPSFAVNVVDTVGAGDSFDAGFIFGYLNGWGINRSLRLAVACGALSTQGQGGTSAQPTLEEAMCYVN
jgi:sugar/nucleoside kinase (ribokinase family)